jgi:hypothetical protein
MVIELRAPSFRNLETWLPALLCMATLVRMGMALRERSPAQPGARDDLFELLLVLWGFASFLHFRRDLWLAVACPTLALAGRLPSWPFPWRPGPGWRAPLWVAELMALLWAPLALTIGLSDWPEARLRAELAVDYPAGAVAYVEQHQLPGPLYNHFNWGGYLIWALPRLPVAMDGRTNLRSLEATSANLGAWEGTAEDPLLATSNLVITDRDKHALSRLLAHDPAWQRVFQDDISEVFVRQGALSGPPSP